MRVIRNNHRFIALTSLLLSHLLVLMVFLLEDRGIEVRYVLYAAWFFGIISVISNVYLADEQNSRIWEVVLLILSGIFWFFLPFLFTYFGIPGAVIFLILSVKIHIKAYGIRRESRTENKNA